MGSDTLAHDAKIVGCSRPGLPHLLSALNLFMKPTDLRGILQYIPRFREKIFVIAIDGAIVTEENFANILLDVAVLRSLNIRAVIVHGASALIRALADERGVHPSDLEGSGVTDSETLKLALTAANRLTHEILEGLSANDLRAVTTNGIIAHPLGILQGVDHLDTGKVERVDVELFQSLLAQGVIPVVPTARPTASTLTMSLSRLRRRSKRSN
jgi:amino-acid N-acetyltransferase